MRTRRIAPFQGARSGGTGAPGRCPWAWEYRPFRPQSRASARTVWRGSALPSRVTCRREGLNASRVSGAAKAGAILLRQDYGGQGSRAPKGFPRIDGLPRGAGRILECDGLPPRASLRACTGPGRLVSMPTGFMSRNRGQPAAHRANHAKGVTQRAEAVPAALCIFIVMGEAIAS